MSSRFWEETTQPLEAFVPTSVVRRPPLVSEAQRRSELAQLTLQRLEALELVRAKPAAFQIAGVRVAPDRQAAFDFLRRRPLVAVQVLHLLSSAFTEEKLAQLLDAQLEATHMVYLDF